VFWGSTFAIRGFQQLTFAKRGFQQLSFPDVAFAPKYYARCGFRSYSLCDPWISDGIWRKSSDRLMRSVDFSSKLFQM
jgi:hypothetical protein